MFQTVGHTWLRLTRTGHQFTAEQSTNGTNWSVVFTGMIAMPNCIEVGLFTENKMPIGSITATFNHVNVGSQNSLSTPSIGDFETEAAQHLNVTLFPNPAKSKITIQMDSVEDQNRTISLYNQLGRFVESQILETGQVQLNWDIQTLESGVYFMEIPMQDGKRKVMRFAKN